MSAAADVETPEDIMYTTPSSVAEQIAREYSRSRIREAEAIRAARHARTAARQDPTTEGAPGVVARVRRWRIRRARWTTA